MDTIAGGPVDCFSCEELILEGSEIADYHDLILCCVCRDDFDALDKVCQELVKQLEEGV